MKSSTTLNSPIATDKNSATLGLLTWNVNMDVSQNGVDFLMDVTNQAHLVDVAAVNAAGQIVRSLDVTTVSCSTTRVTPAERST